MREKMAKKYCFKKNRNIILFSIIDFIGVSFFTVASIVTFRKFRRSSLCEAKKILVIRLSHIGDVLFVTPALRSLRKLFPEAHITMLVGSWAKEIISGNPHIDDIIVYDAYWTNRNKEGEFRLRDEVRFIRQIRRQKFNLAIQFGLDFRDNLSCYLTGIPQRIGPAGAGFGFLLTKTLPWSNGNKHDLVRNLDLVAILGGSVTNQSMEIYIGPEEGKYADRIFKEYKLDNVNLIVAIHPGVGDPNRYWTDESFARTGDMLVRQFEAKIIVLGGSGDIEKASRITSLMESRVINIAGETTIKQMAAVLKKCSICIGLESSCVHIAVAVGTPTVEIFSGFTETKRWAIYGDNTVVIKKEMGCAYRCVPSRCIHKTCMNDIKPEEVVASVAKLLKKEI